MKKKECFSNRLVVKLTLLILLVGILMLVLSIIFAPKANNIEITQNITNKESIIEKKLVEQEVLKQEKEQSKKTETIQQNIESVTVEPESSKPKVVKSKDKQDITKKTEIKKNTQKTTSSNKKGMLVFLFDDAGHNLKQLKPFTELPFPVTIAVLPQLPHSKDAANMIRAAGKKVMLHQPMQAINLSTDPGPGAIFPEMNSKEIQTLLEQNLLEVGPVCGMNNHEGSLITANQQAVESILELCKQQDIFFLDSRTNSESKVHSVAQVKGIKTWDRDIFLDNTQNKDDIIAMVRKGCTIVDKKGYAILIGHIWSNTLVEILTELYPSLINEGYTFTTIEGLYENFGN